MVRAEKILPRRLHPIARRILRHGHLLAGPRLTRRWGLKAEARFWNTWFDLPEANLAERLDPAITDPTVLACFAKLSAQELALIDVGAGPLSTLGTRAPGKRVRLTAVDPLAERYDEVLAARGITPLVRTQPCAGEQLLERFKPNMFDLAFSENALDHAAEPLAVIANMVALVRPGGFVVLNHVPNEGQREGYGTLHQWNFAERDGRCVLWRPGVMHDLGDSFPSVTVRCTTEARKHGPRVICVLSKSSDPAESLKCPPSNGPSSPSQSLGRPR